MLVVKYLKEGHFYFKNAVIFFLEVLEFSPQSLNSQLR